MLTFFPTLYPDETLYSGWARYAERTGFPQRCSLNCDLFDRYESRLVFQFPFETNIGNFVKALNQNPMYTSEYLINNHTLLPLFAITLTSKKYVRTKAKMIGTHTDGYIILGWLTYSFPNFARFCENCVVEDLERYGETYWHRSHQIPGIVVCPRHSSILKNSLFFVRRKGSLHDLATARKSVSPSCPDTIKIEDPNYLQLQKSFSINANYLLDNPDHGLTRVGMANRILYLLIIHNLASSKGTLYNRKIIQLLNSKYSPAILSNFDFARQNNKYGWLKKLLKGNACFAPITYFLLLDFLDINLLSFIGSPEQYQPFGTGPWNCYNPVCKHYMTPVINDYQTHQNADKDVGLFSCECGFSYTVSHLRSTPSDHHSEISIVMYGNVWLKKLQDLLNKADTTYDEIAKCLGISTRTVGIKRKQILGSRLIDKSTSRENLRETKRKEYRKKWMIINKSGLSREQLRHSCENIWMWLYRNDRDWLERVSPKPRKSGRTKQHSPNWQEIDKDLALTRIPDVINNLYAHYGKPIRITKSEISRQLNVQRDYFDSNKKYLPNTTEIIANIREKKEHFILRSIEYKGDCSLKSGKVLIISEFKSEMRRYGHIPEVMKKIYDTIERVNKELEYQQ